MNVFNIAINTCIRRNLFGPKQKNEQKNYSSILILWFDWYSISCVCVCVWVSLTLLLLLCIPKKTHILWIYFWRQSPWHKVERCKLVYALNSTSVERKIYEKKTIQRMNKRERQINGQRERKNERQKTANIVWENSRRSKWHEKSDNDNDDNSNEKWKRKTHFFRKYRATISLRTEARREIDI